MSVRHGWVRTRYGLAARRGLALTVAGILFIAANGAHPARAAEGATPDTITGPSRPANTTGNDELTTVVVTGSYIRRTDTETPSPLQVISTEEIEKSGKVSISDVIRSVSADNSGSLTQNFSGALAGGASGISLRGLTLDATLVLVDGHRMAPYPLADDGQRPFVDLSSLPMSIVDRVEVLKDGASAIYGSDAIAGVVNVILKHDFQGVQLDTDFGSSYRGDGLTQRVSGLWGFGDLKEDGHNVYFNVEYRHQASISQQNRPSYLSDLDLTQYGGPDRRGGVVQQAWPNNETFTVPGMVAPQYAVQAGDPNAGYYMLPGCAKQNLDPSGGCIWNINQYNKIQPRTEGLNLSGRWTQSLGEGWQSALAVSWFNSQAEQYRQSDAYSTGPVTIPYTWVGSKGALVDQTNPNSTTMVLPANSPDNPFNPASPYFSAAQAYYSAQGANFASYVGQPALLYAVLTDFPDQQIKFSTDVIRIVEDLTGKAGGWDLNFSLGYIRDATTATYIGFIRNSLLSAALANGTYRVGANADLNPPSLYAELAPQTSDIATSELGYVSAGASRMLWSLPGGPLGVAVGAEARYLRANNPGEPYADEGDIIMDGSFYAHGSQSVSAAFVELNAPVLSSLEVDVAGRVDHYNFPSTSFTPKLGLKWTPVSQVAFRGTYAKGFRAPGIAEAGDSGTGSATTAPVDALRCPYTNKPSDCGFGYAATLSVGNPTLRPEHSRSYTIGVVLEPIKRVNFTFDYYNIRRDNEIVPAPLGLEAPVRGVQQPGTDYPGPIIYYPQPYVNAADSQTSGYDGAAHIEVPMGYLGKLTFSLDANYVITSDQTFFDPVNGNQTFHYAGTAGPTAVGGAVGTPRTRGTFTTDWTRGPLSVGATVNYRGPMKGIDESVSGDTCLQLSSDNPHCYIASFTYVDLYGQYTFGDHLQVTGSITNLMNRLPPLNTVTYGGFNYNPSLDQAGAVGRFYELGLRYRYY
ncbi:MAG TPA: TonB-dependent receptor [Steroidobacteraceae bacterium]|nr:TonB-dependent receptor [Steroidobacteraceae bacterium]